MTPEFPIGTHVLIARVLEDLSPKGLCDVTVHLHADAVRIPAGADPCIWSAPVHDLVERIHRALLTSWSSQELSSPVAQADAAKRDRDLGGELGALMGGAASLQRQPWYPARVGDLVHIAYEAISDDLPASGATYQVRQDPDEPAGFLGLAEPDRPGGDTLLLVGARADPQAADG